VRRTARAARGEEHEAAAAGVVSSGKVAEGDGRAGADVEQVAEDGQPRRRRRQRLRLLPAASGGDVQQQHEREDEQQKPLR